MKTSMYLIPASFLLFACSNENSLIFEGKVKRETIQIAPKYAGRIEMLRVHEGQLVKKGDTLAVIAIPEAQAKYEQAAGALMSAQAQYQMALRGATSDQEKQAAAQLEASLQQLEFAKKTVKRLEKMIADSLIPAQQFDEAQTKLAMAQAGYEAAEAKMQEAAGPVREEQIAMALGQRKRAAGALAEAEIARNEQVITSPVDLQVETIALSTGELALPGYSFVTGYRTGLPYFRVTIPESEISTFKVGMPCVVSVAQGGQEFAGTIASIVECARYAARTSAYPSHQMGETLYELRIETVNNDAKNLFVNQTVTLKVVKEPAK